MRIVTHAVFFLFLCAAFGLLYAQTTGADEIDEPAWVYKGRGDVHYRKGDTGRAIYEYKKALIRARRENAAFPEVNLQLAKIYRDEGLYELALSQIGITRRNADKLQIPDLLYEARYTTAELYLLMDRYTEALEEYERITGEDENKKGYDTVSVYDIWKEPVGDTLKILRYGEAYYRIGIIKFRSNNIENAIPALKMALLYRYKLDETVVYLMACYERMGDVPAYEFMKEILDTRNVTATPKEEAV